jgi:hypothetical protein
MAEDYSSMYSGWDKGGNYMDEWMDKAIAFFGPCFLVDTDCAVLMYRMPKFMVLGGQENHWHTLV